MPVELTPAWLLHRRPYKERAVIAEFLVEDHGRLAMVIQGGRSPAKGKAALLQPFSQVLVSWRGRNELKSLIAIEPYASARLLGSTVFCGLYVNELVLRAVLPGQQLEGLTALYAMVLNQLATPAPVEPILRCFELQLLQMTGYLPDLTHDARHRQPLVQHVLYDYQPNVGLIPISDTASQSQNRERYSYSAPVLLSLARRDFSNTAFYPAFKRFTRQALEPLLGGRPLKSRELFARKNDKRKM